MATANLKNRDINVKVGERIRFYRIRRKLGQVDIARELDISPSVISNLESGKAMVGIYTLLDIIRVLNIGIEDIFPEYTSYHADQEGEQGYLKLHTALRNYPDDQRDKIISDIAELMTDIHKAK